MNDPFATALAVLHSAAGSVAAIYTPKGGEPLPNPIRVIWAQGSQATGGRNGDRIADTNSFDVQRSDVAQPSKGDTLQVADAQTAQMLTFRINGAAILDVEGMSWACPTEPV